MDQFIFFGLFTVLTFQYIQFHVFLLSNHKHIDFIIFCALIWKPRFDVVVLPVYYTMHYKYIV